MATPDRLLASKGMTFLSSPDPAHEHVYEQRWENLCGLPSEKLITQLLQHNRPLHPGPRGRQLAKARQLIFDLRPSMNLFGSSSIRGNK